MSSQDFNSTDIKNRSDDELLGDLGVDVEDPKANKRTAREERIIAGFEEIVDFFEKHDRLPAQGAEEDIFERLYAVRLTRIRSLPEASELLAEIDSHSLLSRAIETDLESDTEQLPDDELLAELGVTPSEEDITNLKHVVSRKERQTAEDIASRTACSDFGMFKPIFDQTQEELDSGVLESIRFEQDASVSKSDTFILGGQLVYVAETGPEMQTTPGKSDARLRVIYSNGTESNLLRRSLQRALYKDEAGRRVRLKEIGGLFGEDLDEGDTQSGIIYVLRSLSDHPFIAEHRELVHKIGVTGGDVAARISNAKLDPTFLLAGVEVVAEYKLVGINRTKLERLLHKLFLPAQIDLTIPDRFGNQVRPEEWFLVPIQVIDEAVTRIRDGSIEPYTYDPATASLVSL